MKRRDFLQTSLALVSALSMSAVGNEGSVTPTNLPRWRGFNLLEKFTLRHNSPYKEQDFEWMAQWGFDFVRLPTDYRCWTDENDQKKLDESILKHIDQAVEFGKQYNIHVNLNMHRAPGYCVNPPEEKLDLFSDEKAVELFCYQWENFAKRYKGIPNHQVSFDLLNEPKANIDENVYTRVMTDAIQAIRQTDPDRLIVVDGLSWGQKPVHSLADKKIAQSTRGYNPFQISHYKASWVNYKGEWPEPKWPMQIGDTLWDKEVLRERYIQPWQELENKGVGVHVGEWGCYRFTPHNVALDWMEDCLSLWKEVGWGWSLWNLRGSFGILDSQRDDVNYESFHGHKLDRKMLELLLKY